MTLLYRGGARRLVFGNWLGVLALGTCLNALPAAALAQKIEPDVLHVAEKGGAQSVSVVLYLRHQHAAEAAEVLAPSFQPRIDFLADQMRSLSVSMRGMESMDRQQERELLRQRPSLFDQGAIEPLAREMNAARDEYARAVMAWARDVSGRDFAAVRAFVARLGGTVVNQTYSVSAVLARIPASSLKELEQCPDVALVGLDHPGQPELDISAPSIGAPAFWSNSVTGFPYDLGILDTGVQQDHLAFAGITFFAQPGTNPDMDGHGTHVFGIMASRDPIHRGVTYGAVTATVGFADTEAVSMVGLDWMLSNTPQMPENVNHSFGYGTANQEDYKGTDQFFDGAADTFGFSLSKSAGNNGSAFMNLTHPGPAYNLMTVTSLDDQNTLSRAGDRISSLSSWGPTVNGRKKPDLCAPGDDIVSTMNDGGFLSMSGTSMAAPHVGGSVLLLMARGVPSPLSAKAVLINTADGMDSKDTFNTADDQFVAGSHWDKAYGWGYINLNEAFLHGPDVFERTLASPNGGARQFRLFKGQMFQDEKATLTWNRHVAWNGANYPTIVRALSNLDLTLYSWASGTQAAQSASTIDNVEQVSAPANGFSVLKVSAEGNFDPAVATERFALATQENFVEAAGPNLTVTFSKGFGTGFLAPFTYTATVKNTGDVPMFNVLVGMVGYQTLGGPNPASLVSLMPGQSIPVAWTVRRMPGIFQHARVDVSSSSYGETFTWSVTDPAPL
ncbi:MAG: S8 family serine peptidase [Armatimonadetes bacterium]|nr:S8 family serine peptidase [Armatimonadota bacterium]